MGIARSLGIRMLAAGVNPTPYPSPPIPPYPMVTARRNGIRKTLEQFSTLYRLRKNSVRREAGVSTPA
jgi:hypothetical protein